MASHHTVLSKAPWFKKEGKKGKEKRDNREQKSFCSSPHGVAVPRSTLSHFNSGTLGTKQKPSGLSWGKIGIPPLWQISVAQSFIFIETGEGRECLLLNWSSRSFNETFLKWREQIDTFWAERFHCFLLSCSQTSPQFWAGFSPLWCSVTSQLKICYQFWKNPAKKYQELLNKEIVHGSSFTEVAFKGKKLIFSPF